MEALSEMDVIQFLMRVVIFIWHGYFRIYYNVLLWLLNKHGGNPAETLLDRVQAVRFLACEA